FNPYKVNRAFKSEVSASGKGINFTGVFQRIGGNPLVAQFVAGETGNKITEGLARCSLANISTETAGVTRVCSTIVCHESGQMTELIESAPPVSKRDMNEMLVTLTKSVQDIACIAICGTFPDGVDNKFLEKVIELYEKKIIFVDACRGISDLLKSGVDVVKINMEELFSLTGAESIVIGIEIFYAKYKVDILAVTDGPSDAYLKCGNRFVSYQIPRQQKVVNTLGAGDTASAVFVKELTAGVDCVQAFKKALSCSTASCLTAIPTEFDMDIARKIYDRIEIKYE
ncbi:MAG: PfkB family carbohydrate kinase, partial [Verrucomicrobiota bacterium]|nr:PfkB family carbohydrate kinase [Verrucomicrobiota bacterium]